jgi:hypothetical protein
MPKEPPVKPHSTDILNYPSTMSGFEKDSLVAEAKLKQEREKPSPKSPKRTRNVSNDCVRQRADGSHFLVLHFPSQPTPLGEARPWLITAIFE